MSSKGLAIFAIFFLVILSVPVLAQEQEASSAVTEEPPRGEAVPQEVQVDSEVTPAELGVGEQNLLPDSPFYPLKETWREVQHAFTFSNEGDARLDLKFASEKLIETQKLVENNADLETISESIGGYEDEIHEFAQESQEAAQGGAELDELQQEATSLHFKQSTILDNLEEGVPEGAVLAVERARDRATQAVVDTLTEHGSFESIHKVLSEAAAESGHSEFSGLKALEVLKGVEERAPEAAKEAILTAQENILAHLEEGVNQIPEAERLAKMAAYVRHMPGDETKRLLVLDEMKFRSNLPPEILSQMELMKAKAAEKFNERFKKFESQEVKDKFFEGLKHGDLSEVRVLDDLKANVLDEDVRAEIEKHHQDSVQKFRDAFKTDAKAQDSASRFEKLTQEIKNSPDPKTFRLLEELRRELAPEQEAFVRRLEEEGRREMSRRFETEPEKFMSRINSANPEDFAFIGEFNEKFGQEFSGEFRRGFEEVVEASGGAFEDRIKAFENPEDLEKFRARFESEAPPEAREFIRREIPDFQKLLEAQRQQFPGAGETGGIFPGEGATGGEFPPQTPIDPAAVCAAKGGVWSGTFCRFESQIAPSPLPLVEPQPQPSFEPQPIFDPARACAEKGGVWNGASCQFPQEQFREGDFQKVFGIFLEVFL